MERRVASKLVYVLGALLVVVAALGVPVSANAAPDSTDPAEATAVTMSWPALGLPRVINLNGPNSNQDFSVPVPLGLNAVRLHGVIHAPVNLGAGYLEVSETNGAFLGAVNLPPVAANQVVTPFDIDISAARARASAIGLSFTVRQVDSAGQICGPMQQLVISDLSVGYSGTEPPPTTIATFFPPALQRVTVYAPSDADVSEQQAVLTLVSALVRDYAPQQLAVTVVNQPRGAIPPPAPQLARAVVVERGPAGLNIGNPATPGAYLRVSGRGDELPSQTSILVNELQSLVQVPAARVDQAGAHASLTGDTVTFSQLNMTGRAEVIRTGNMSVGTDRAALGSGRIDNVRVHLLADYTPVAKRDAATVMVRANGVVVYSQALDGTGRIDKDFVLPRQALGQRISLDFTLTYTPRQECGPMIAPLTFQVDPRSSLTVQRGGPPPGGFGSVPSEFSPAFYVALDGTSPNQLRYAARVVADIARLTKVSLSPRVVDVKAAAEAEQAALIVANANTVKQTPLNPPLSGAGSTVGVDLPTELRADIDRGLGSIQVFADAPRNRTVALITTTDAWTLVDPLLDYIDGLDTGWSALTGDVLAAGAAGVPANVAIRAGDDIFGPVRSDGGNRWVVIAAAITLAVVALAAIGTLLVRRRSRRDASQGAS